MLTICKYTTLSAHHRTLRSRFFVREMMVLHGIFVIQMQIVSIESGRNYSSRVLSSYSHLHLVIVPTEGDH